MPKEGMQQVNKDHFLLDAPGPVIQFALSALMYGMLQCGNSGNILKVFAVAAQTQSKNCHARNIK